MSCEANAFFISDTFVYSVSLSLRVKSNELKGTERHSVPLPIKMRNLKGSPSSVSVSTFQEAWPRCCMAGCGAD